MISRAREREREKGVCGEMVGVAFIYCNPTTKKNAKTRELTVKEELKKSRV